MQQYDDVGGEEEDRDESAAGPSWQPTPSPPVRKQRRYYVVDDSPDTPASPLAHGQRSLRDRTLFNTDMVASSPKPMHKHVRLCELRTDGFSIRFQPTNRPRRRLRSRRFTWMGRWST